MPTRQPSKPTKSTPETVEAKSLANGHAAAGESPADSAPTTEASAVLQASTDLARAGLAAISTQRPVRRLGATTPAAAATPVVTTAALTDTSPAFGTFVKSVGLAVAEAQTALDKTLVDTAKALSETQIDVIAVFEQQIDDDGKMTQGNAIVQKLPLVNYLMPTAYQWSRVYLQADMRVSEFSAANGFNIQAKSNSFSVGGNASYGAFSGLSAGGGISYGTSSSQVAGGTTASQDVSAGSMHMEATLEPRADIELPKPFVLQKGPELRLAAGSMVDVTDAETGQKVIGHKVTITAELKGSSGALLAGKLLEVRLSQPLPYTLEPLDGKTDPNGNLKVEITRSGAGVDPTKPIPVELRVWLGLVNQSITVQL